MSAPQSGLGATGAAMRPFIAGHWRALAGAGVCSVFVALAELAKPWPIALIVDHVIADHEAPFAPDMGALSFGEILDRVWRICDAVSIPIIADADTGYGGPLNVIRTMREFERAGVSAVQIEDQEWPKKCGHEPGRKVASSKEMEQRIRAAADARVDADVMIVARTDAIAIEGYEAALERAARYREAGADIAFVEAPPSEAELAQVPKRLDMPCLANMVEGGRTPVLPFPTLEAMGFKVAIYPNSLTRLFARAGQDLLAGLKSSGGTAGFANQMLDHGQLWSLFENEKWQALEKRFQ